MKDFIQSLPDDSRAIKVSKELLEGSELSNDLAMIKANFKVLRESITLLEERLPLREALSIIQKVKNSLTIPKFAGKMDEILKKNPGFEKLSQIGSVLSGEKVQGLKEDPNIIASFSCAPMTSVDCERAFSTFKELLSIKRNRLTEDHLKDQMLIQWNQALL